MIQPQPLLKCRRVLQGSAVRKRSRGKNLVFRIGTTHPRFALKNLIQSPIMCYLQIFCIRPWMYQTDRATGRAVLEPYGHEAILKTRYIAHKNLCMPLHGVLLQLMF